MMDDYLLKELVHHLPSSARWTKDHRDLWLLAMQAAVDLIMFERFQVQQKEKRIVLPVFWNFVKGQ